MDRKLMRENLLGMMVLVILILIEVQATDHTSTSFHLSSVPIPFSHLSKLDFANLDLRNCIDKQHELCVKKSGIEYGNCLTRGFRICLELPKSQLDPEYKELAFWQESSNRKRWQPFWSLFVRLSQKEC